MRSVYFKEGIIELVDRGKPSLSDGDALLKVLVAGICNTDIELHRGYYGFEGVPGHEFVAEVEECPARPELIGKRVVADINCPVGPYKGDPRHAPHRTVIGIVNHDGAFAEYLKAPAENLVVVSDDLADNAAVFAEPLAAGLEVSQQIHVTGNMRVMVLGDGKLGLLTALGLKIYNPDILLVGKHEEKLLIAAAQGVSTHCISNPEELTDLAAEWDKFDLVVEATGSEKGINYAMDFVRPEGTIVAKTTSHLPSSINLAKLVVDEISIVGSRCGDIRLAMNVLEQGLVDVSGLIEAEYNFTDFREAFERAMSKGAMKVLVRM